MALTKYDPFQDVVDFPSGFRSFADSVNRMLSEPRSGRPWTPAVDIFETDNELVIKADLPEVDMKGHPGRDRERHTHAQGERKFEAREQGAGYHRIERSYGSFARYFSLPDTVEADKVKADYKNGALTVTLAKKEIAKPRTVKVEVHQ